jgi:hypothetical protein
MMGTSSKQNGTRIYEGKKPSAGQKDMTMNGTEGKRIPTDCIISFYFFCFILNKWKTKLSQQIPLLCRHLAKCTRYDV